MGETIHEGWLVKSPPDKKSQSLPRFFQAVSRHDFPVNYIITVIFKHAAHAYVQIGNLSVDFFDNFTIFDICE